MGSEPTCSLGDHQGDIFQVYFPVIKCHTTVFQKIVIDGQGTEYYDGKAKRYVDFPITDILQMMGRAGRPQFDQHGKAVILVHEPKKSFYKKVNMECIRHDVLCGWISCLIPLILFPVSLRTIPS